MCVEWDNVIKKLKNSEILNILCLICFTKALTIGAFS